MATVCFYSKKSLVQLYLDKNRSIIAYCPLISYYCHRYIDLHLPLNVCIQQHCTIPKKKDLAPLTKALRSPVAVN